MILLKVLRPADIPNRKSNWGYRVRFYHWLLLRLLSVYKKCAISDTLNLGETQIIHNVRDYWYEQELMRFHIDTAQHLERQSAPYNMKRKSRRSSLFNWSESLLIFHNGKSYNIKRSDLLSIESDLDGQLKVSSTKDFIFRTEFVAKVTKPRKDSTSDEVTVTAAPNQEKGKQARQRVPMRDTVPTDPSPAKPAVESVKYRGFEENSIF